MYIFQYTYFSLHDRSMTSYYKNALFSCGLSICKEKALNLRLQNSQYFCECKKDCYYCVLCSAISVLWYYCVLQICTKKAGSANNIAILYNVEKYK